MDLFADHKQGQAPLAHRVRPKTFEDIIGQDHLTKALAPFRSQIEQGHLRSFLLWGPPGTGKTTLAQIAAQRAGLPMVSFSAVMSGIKEIKQMMEKASLRFQSHGISSLVFVDEIHRFNKSQQDAFLPYVESGEIILAGATTENPSFEINNALLSRLKVFLLHELDDEAIVDILKRALKVDPYISERKVPETCLEVIAQRSVPDAREALNALEYCLNAQPKDAELSAEQCELLLGKKILRHDAAGESHYNLISALHKSIRNSDVNASLYWLGCLLEGGEDPKYVVRRLIRFASEDIGNADPQALQMAINAKEAIHFIGIPEGKLALAQLVIYLSAAPKSNSVYQAYQKVERDLQAGKVYPVPLALRNASTSLMKDIGYGKDYAYAHNSPKQTTSMQCLPDALKDRTYYEGIESGQETALMESLKRYQMVKEENSET